MILCHKTVGATFNYDVMSFMTIIFVIFVIPYKLLISAMSHLVNLLAFNPLAISSEIQDASYKDWNKDDDIDDN